MKPVLVYLLVLISTWLRFTLTRESKPILPVAEDLVEGPAGEGLPTVWTTGPRGASSGSPAPRLHCDAELQMPELREKVAALREGGEMPEDSAEQLRDFYLPACLNCGGISDFEFTTDAFGGLCGSEWEEMMRTMRPKFHRPSWLSALILLTASSDLTLPYGRIVHDYLA